MNAISVTDLVKAGLIERKVAERPGFKLAVARDLEPGEVSIYGPLISNETASVDEMGFEYTSPTLFANAIKAAEGDEVMIRIDSPGGQLSAGASILATIREQQKKRKVTALVEGIAASAASFAAFAADTLYMSELAEIYAHRAQIVAVGDANTMRSAAKSLDKSDAQLAAFYESEVPLDALGFANGIAFMEGDDGFGTFVTATEVAGVDRATIYNLNEVDTAASSRYNSLEASADATLSLIRINSHRGITQ